MISLLIIIALVIIFILLLTVWGERNIDKVKNIKWLYPLQIVLIHKQLRIFIIDILGAAVIIWFALFFVNWLQPTLTPAALFPPPFSGPVAVRAAKVTEGPVVNVATYTGQVLPYESNDVYARVDGFVNKMNVYQGDYVKKGQTLAKLDLSSLLPKVMKSAADSTFWSAELNRTKGLFKDSAVTTSNYDYVRKMYQQAVAQLQLARTNVSYADIRAGVSGYVAERSIYPGQFVKRGMKMFRLDRLDSIRVQFQVSEGDLPFIKKGDLVWLEFPQVSMQAFKNYNGWKRKIKPLTNNEILSVLGAGKLSEKDFSLNNGVPGMTARVAVVFPAEDPVTHTGTVEVRLSNPGILLKAQSYIVAKFAVSRVQNTIRIVNNAVIQLPQGGKGVYLAPKMSNRGFARLQKIKVGLSSPYYTQVLSGVKPGDFVIYVGQKDITQGMSVLVIERDKE